MHVPVQSGNTAAAPRARRRLHTRPAFSVFEAVLIVVIIAVCIAIVLPRYLAYRSDSHSSRMVRTLHELGTAEQVYRTSHGVYTTNSATLAVPVDPGSHLEILTADSSGWSARIRRDDSPTVCAVFSGIAAPVPPATAKDVIGCSK